MKATEMMKMYGKKYENRTFESLFGRSIRLNRLDCLSFKWVPFLDNQIISTREAYCIFAQCIAIEKGWAK